MSLLNRIFEAGRKLDQRVYHKLGINKVAEAIRPKLPPSLARFGGKFGPVLAVFALIALSAVALSGTTGLTTEIAGNKAGQEASDEEAVAAAEAAEAKAAEAAQVKAAAEAAAKGGAPTAGSALSGGRETGRGITDTTVTIGVIVLENLDSARTDYGSSECGSDCGDNRVQTKAVIDYVNANGGVAKRKLVPIYHAIDIRTADHFDVVAQKACVDFTEDHRVFAVADLEGSGFYQKQLIACLAKNDTPWIGWTDVDQKFADDYAPYLYAPSWLNQTRAGRALVLGLVRQGFFEPGARIGLLRYDDPPSERAAVQGTKPTLAAHGLKVTSEAAATFPPGRWTDLGTMEAQLSNAALRFNTDGITHLLIQDRKGLAGYYMPHAQSQGYRGKYGLTSASTPRDLRSAFGAPEEQLRRVRGVGWTPVTDVGSGERPPPNANGRLCIEIMKRAGLPGPAEDQKGLSYCDDILFLKLALDRASALTTAGFQAAVDELGTTYEPPLSFLARFGPGRHDGVSAMRSLAFDDGCTCFRYVGDLEPVE